MKRRELLRGGSLVLLLGTQQIAFGASIVAVRLWPAPDYTRLTIESDGLLQSRFSTTTQNFYLDVDGIALDPTLREDGQREVTLRANTPRGAELAA